MSRYPGIKLRGDCATYGYMLPSGQQFAVVKVLSFHDHLVIQAHFTDGAVCSLGLYNDVVAIGDPGVLVAHRIDPAEPGQVAEFDIDAGNVIFTFQLCPAGGTVRCRSSGVGRSDLFPGLQNIMDGLCRHPQASGFIDDDFG